MHTNTYKHSSPVSDAVHTQTKLRQLHCFAGVTLNLHLNEYVDKWAWKISLTRSNPGEAGF